MARRRALRAPTILIALAVGIALAACGPAAPSAAGPSATPATQASLSPTAGAASPASSLTADPAAIYAAIERQVQQLRELTATSPVDPKLLDAATLKKNLAADFAKNNPADRIMANQRLLELMGLLPAGSSLMDLYVKLLGSQVAGYYDPATKALNVLSRSGGLGVVERVIFAHEFTHALQDQHFGLANLQVDAIGQGDESLAHVAVAEGDAMLLVSFWMRANLTLPELAQLVAASTDPAATRILAVMPDILKQTLLFPYTAGLQLVEARQAAGGWAAVDAMYARLPASTEQVLHPEKYAAGELPIPVLFPADLAARLGSGWSVDLQDTLGEFQLRVWLEAAGKLPTDAATTAAAGWGGDRVALVRNGDRLGAVLDTRWDSAKDAAEFAAAAQTTLGALTAHHATIALAGTNRVTLLLASDDATIGALAGVLGLAQ